MLCKPQRVVERSKGGGVPGMLIAACKGDLEAVELSWKLMVWISMRLMSVTHTTVYCDEG